MGRTAQFSIRMPTRLVDALDERGRRAGADRSTLARRYVEEGLRMDEHPGIGFRPGPAGRRPVVVGGPDVWEIVRVVRNVEERGEAAIAAAAEWLGIPVAAVAVAVRYYADYRDEVDAWIERVDRDAAEAQAAGTRRRDVLT